MQEAAITPVNAIPLYMCVISTITSFLIQSRLQTSEELRSKDRILVRRIAIHFMNIEETRDYLDLLLSALKKLRHIDKAVRYSKGFKSETQQLKEILWLIGIARKKRFWIDALNDPALRRLDEELTGIIRAKEHDIARLINQAETCNSVDYTLIFEEMSKEYKNASACITEMENRLHTLRQIIP